MTTISKHILNSQRLKHGTACLTGLILTGMAGWSGYQHVKNPQHPGSSRYSRAEIRGRAEQLGLALNGSVRLVTEPMLHEEQACNHKSVFAERKLWIVLCESGNRQLNLSIDDATGHLACLVMDGSASGKAEKKVRQVELKTGRDAAIAAVARLRVLETLPQTAQIALREKPFEERRQSLWHINWLVRNTAKSAPYTIKMSLNSETGLPTYLVNLEAKG